MPIVKGTKAEERLPVSGMYGVDVSKDKLDISDGKNAIEINNSKSAIRKWLKSIPAASKIAMEATGIYSSLLADMAAECHHTVYVINPHYIREYRKCQGIRYKSDASDAHLIQRYLEKEGDRLHCYVAPTAMQRQVQAVLGERALLSKTLTQLRQNQRSTRERLGKSLNSQPVIDAMEKQLKALERELVRLKDQINDPGFDRLLLIKGIGMVTAASMWLIFSRYSFKSSDAAVKFAGMDFQFQDSGKKTGKRTLSKRGDAELRRVLYCAALAGCKSKDWHGVYQRYRDRAFKPIQSLCILARKILRTAWAVYYQGVAYDPARINNATA